MIKFLVHPLVEIWRNLQNIYIYCNSNGQLFCVTKYVVAVLREFMIVVVVVTEIFCPGWPVQNVKEIDNSQINFNEIFLSDDSFGTLLLRWIENLLVLLVATVHTVMDVSKCLRRIPRVNKKNKIHVETFCGKYGKVHVCIPPILHNYNHWMCEVDKSYGNISYNHPDIFWNRAYNSMFIQLLPIILFNSNILYVSHYPRSRHYKPAITPKYFWWRFSGIFE